MKNIDVLRMLPIGTFSTIVHYAVTKDYPTEAEFRAMLERDFPEEGKEALEKLILQRLSDPDMKDQAVRMETEEFPSGVMMVLTPTKYEGGYLECEVEMKIAEQLGGA